MKRGMGLKSSDEPQDWANSARSSDQTFFEIFANFGMRNSDQVIDLKFSGHRI